MLGSAASVQYACFSSKAFSRSGAQTWQFSEQIDQRLSCHALLPPATFGPADSAQHTCVFIYCSFSHDRSNLRGVVCYSPTRGILPSILEYRSCSIFRTYLLLPCRPPSRSIVQPAKVSMFLHSARAANPTIKTSGLFCSSASSTVHFAPLL